jgi:hypothetical protein
MLRKQPEYRNTFILDKVGTDPQRKVSDVKEEKVTILI